MSIPWICRVCGSENDNNVKSCYSCELISVPSVDKMLCRTERYKINFDDYPGFIACKGDTLEDFEFDSYYEYRQFYRNLKNSKHTPWGGEMASAKAYVGKFGIHPHSGLNEDDQQAVKKMALDMIGPIPMFFTKLASWVIGIISIMFIFSIFAVLVGIWK